jgi:hypothetical protein
MFSNAERGYWSVDFGDNWIIEGHSRDKVATMHLSARRVMLYTLEV